MSFYAGSTDPVIVSDDIPSSLRQDGKAPDQFRVYSAGTRDGVRDFYHLNHKNQTLDFVLRKKAEYTPGAHGDMGVWEALEYLNQIVDDSDPDLDLPQIIHGLQT
ncbi:MAG: inositol oxygenase family protein, partial [Blastocatellia bacterium]